MLERMCQRLAQEWEAEGSIVSDAPGVWVIPLDGDIEIVLSATDTGFLGSAQLGPLPLKRRTEFIKMLMAANLLGQGTQGAVLALDEKDQVTVSRNFNAITTQRDFQEAIEDFISTVDQWKAVALAAHSS